MHDTRLTTLPQTQIQEMTHSVRHVVIHMCCMHMLVGIHAIQTSLFQHSCMHKHTHHHRIKISALPMQDNNCSSPPFFSLNCLQFFFSPSVHLSPFPPPSLPSLLSFVSYCLPAVLISAPLIFQPMNWSHWLYHCYCRLQPSLIYVPFFSLSSSLSLSTVPLTGM